MMAESLALTAPNFLAIRSLGKPLHYALTAKKSLTPYYMVFLPFPIATFPARTHYTHQISPSILIAPTKGVFY